MVLKLINVFFKLIINFYTKYIMFTFWGFPMGAIFSLYGSVCNNQNEINCNF